MAATNFFVASGASRNQDLTATSELVSGTATDATSYIELRMMTVKADGTTATGLQRIDVLKFLQTLRKWISEGGLLADGTNVPVT